MEKTTEQPLIAIKDGAVLVPIGASALAICWEIGSFFPIGGQAFSYFALTEHIAFAAPALPAALVVVSSFFVGALIGDLSSEKFVGPYAVPPPADIPIQEQLTQMKSRLASLSRIKRWSLIVGAAWTALLVAGAIYLKLLSLWVLVLMDIVAICRLFLPAKYRQPIIEYGVVGIIAMCLATAMGADSMRAHLNRSTEQTIATAEGQLNVVVVRSGERGVLLYDRQHQHYFLRKWEAIKGIEWDRASLLSGVR